MAAEQDKKQKHHKALRVIRNVYLYLVTMIGMITMIFGAVGLVNNIFQNYIFQVNDYVYMEPFPSRGGYCAQQYVDVSDPEGKRMLKPTDAEIQECERRQKEQNEQNRRNTIGREFSIAIAQIGVGFPVWMFHWGVIQKEYRKRKEEENSEE